MTKLMSLALALGLALFSACGGNHNPASSSPPETLPTPPVVVCTPQYPPTLTTGYMLPPGRGLGEVIITEKASIKLTFAWTPTAARTGVFVVPNNGTICNVGKACDNALASDYTSASPKVIQTGVLNPGSYLAAIENLENQSIFVDSETTVEICK